VQRKLCLIAEGYFLQSGYKILSFTQGIVLVKFFQRNTNYKRIKVLQETTFLGGRGHSASKNDF